MKRIVWTDPARIDVRRLCKPIAMQILSALHRFVESGVGDVKTLRGREELRLPAGDYPIFFGCPDFDTIEVRASPPSRRSLSLRRLARIFDPLRQELVDFLGGHDPASLSVADAFVDGGEGFLAFLRGENFLQALSIASHACTGRLSPSLSDFKPVRGHADRILRPDHPQYHSERQPYLRLKNSDFGGRRAPCRK